MHSRTAASALVLLCGATCLPHAVVAQTAKDLTGTWEMVSSINTATNGTKRDVFGPNPNGIAIYEPDGRFVIISARSDLPKFASGNRLKGTTAENQAIVQGSLAYFGTYSIADKVLTLHVDGGTWPSWNGTDQRRTISSFDKNEMTWTLRQSIGGTGVTTWRRVQ